MTDACISIRPKSSCCPSRRSTWNDDGGIITILPKASECETLLLWQNGALTWEPLSYNLDNVHIAQYVRTLDPGQRPEDYRFPRGFRTSRERARRAVLAARKRAEGLHPEVFEGGGGDDGDELVEKEKEKNERLAEEEEVYEEAGDAGGVVVVNGEHGGGDDDDDDMTTIAVPTAVAPVLQAILRNFTLTPRPGPPSGGGVSRSAAAAAPSPPHPTLSCNASSPLPPNGAPPPPLMTPDSDAILADCAAEIVIVDSDSTTFVGFSDDEDDDDDESDNPDGDDDTPGPDTASESETEPEYFSPQYFGGLEATTPPGSPSRGYGCTGW
ncbi:hypothetical protein DBV05_g8362 [Lasiodiplodia theobromae]|uniref:Uncharacterized protein n=1 Tax=Lasiodiplodia theobromae TaxID=45133 RepID=A0A5N5D5E1_9PEZI|nr:hypothetical protein DBV05_g8362 [Lasiodiplodia theobromae]